MNQAAEAPIAIPADVSRVELFGQISGLVAQRNAALNEAATLAGKLHQANVQLKALTEKVVALELAAQKAQASEEAREQRAEQGA